MNWQQLIQISQKDFLILLIFTFIVGCTFFIALWLIKALLREKMIVSLVYLVTTLLSFGLLQLFYLLSTNEFNSNLNVLRNLWIIYVGIGILLILHRLSQILSYFIRNKNRLN
ncbi:hypothetical protein CEY16_01500 [Halalkalibacillus sediminis]|uniref:Uncharacterized protein n=1 Tax=Halalkalibacillus sediminis TaxID=2018042 RepID=A0A2I0QWI9_9BACI|nr:hypothetical protein [Halalkalibacillus sediminis]PKR78460.1 hypothetical protein CEY16_01500 [Halalkalibacillus sediminis]